MTKYPISIIIFGAEILALIKATIRIIRGSLNSYHQFLEIGDNSRLELIAGAVVLDYVSHCHKLHYGFSITGGRLKPFEIIESM